MMASVETSSQSIKFSEEFRQVVYKINPDYLSCTHKTLFEINATDNLRDQENDFQIHTNDSTERRKPCYDVNEMKYPSTSISNIAGTYSDSALKVLQSNYISTDRRVSVIYSKHHCQFWYQYIYMGAFLEIQNVILWITILDIKNEHSLILMWIL